MSFLLCWDSWQIPQPFIFVKFLQLSFNSLPGNCSLFKSWTPLSPRIHSGHSWKNNLHSSSLRIDLSFTPWSDWIFIAITHLTLTHQGHKQPSYAITTKHTHTSDLLLLDTTDHQFHLESTLIMGFGDAILLCLSPFPLSYPFSSFPKLFLLCPLLRGSVHQNPKEKTLFSVGISFPLVASAIT